MTADTVHQRGDELLVARFRVDPETFTAVYDRYFAAVHGYVAGRLGRQVADDVAAETFLVAFSRRARFDPVKGALRPWLFGIATNLVAQHRRAEARHYQALSRVDPAADTDSHEARVVEEVTARHLHPHLVRALASLTRGERDVVLLVAIGQLSHEEVAEALGISYGTVGSRLSRARAKLRDAIPTGTGTGEA